LIRRWRQCWVLIPATGQALSSPKFSLAGGTIPAGPEADSFRFQKPDIENFDSAISAESTIRSEKVTSLSGRYEFDRFTKAAVFNPLLLISYTDATFRNHGTKLSGARKRIFFSAAIRQRFPVQLFA